MIAWIASAPGSAAAFGTNDSGGQTASTANSAGRAGLCWWRRLRYGVLRAEIIDYLSRVTTAKFGPVGTPDSDELSDPAAHCANADFLACDYPRSRDQAAAGLMDCVNHLSSWFGKGASSGTLSGPHRSEGCYHAQRHRAGFPVGAEGRYGIEGASS